LRAAQWHGDIRGGRRLAGPGGVLNGGQRPQPTPARAAARRLVIAFQFLTALPTPRLPDAEPDDLTRSAPFFPLVGLVVGLGLAGAVMLGGLINPAVAALAGTLFWVAVTGGLHLDGLGDVADGLGAAHGDPERFRLVLRDPHAGSFAVIAIVLQIAAKLVLLGSLPLAADLWALLLIPAWARWGAMVWSASLPPLWEGSGERFSREIGWWAIALWGVALAGASLLAAPSLLAALIVTPLIGLLWYARLGGISGDCIGASIEITETMLLLALLAGSA
jgi:adenosylcobinamide-GDP ribazoletransferase